MFGIIQSEQRFFKLVRKNPLLVQSDLMHITLMIYTYRLHVYLHCFGLLCPLSV